MRRAAFGFPSTRGTNRAEKLLTKWPYTSKMTDTNEEVVTLGSDTADKMNYKSNP
jgi:hypothetical protein